MSASRDYWFDVDPLVNPPATPPRPRIDSFKQGVTQGSARARLAAFRNADPKGMASDWWNNQRKRPIEAFAEANGLAYEWAVYQNGRDRKELPVLPGVAFRGGEMRDVVLHRGPPWFEVGNDTESASIYGYVAIRHGLPLPHLILDACANDGRSSSLISPSVKAMLEGRMLRLNLGPQLASYFIAYGALDREPDLRELLTADAIALMVDTTASVDVEVVDGWLFLYAYGINLSTEDPEMWAWLLSLASRWWDQLGAWADAGGIGEPQLGELPCYTRERRPRPAKLDERFPRAQSHRAPDPQRETWTDVGLSIIDSIFFR